MNRRNEQKQQTVNHEMGVALGDSQHLGGPSHRLDGPGKEDLLSALAVQGGWRLQMHVAHCGTTSQCFDLPH